MIAFATKLALIRVMQFQFNQDVAKLSEKLVKKNAEIRQWSYYRKLWIRCGNEKGGVPFRVGNANPGGSRVEGEASPERSRRMLKVVDNEDAREAGAEGFELDEIARMGARRMLMAALETEAADYVERHRDQRDAEGRALVVHNGRAQGRKLTLGAGTVELRARRGSTTVAVMNKAGASAL
jgi:hypothetical protein